MGHGLFMKHTACEENRLLRVTAKIVQTEQEKKDAFFVRTEVFVKEQGLPLPLEIDEVDDYATHFVAYYEAMPIAAGRVIIQEKYSTAQVERISVLPQFRRKQIGIQMMQTVETFIREHHPEVTCIKINAQTHAVPFYEKQGYLVVTPEFMDNYIPHRAMEKKLRT